MSGQKATCSGHVVVIACFIVGLIAFVGVFLFSAIKHTSNQLTAIQNAQIHQPHTPQYQRPTDKPQTRVCRTPYARPSEHTSWNHDGRPHAATTMCAPVPAQLMLPQPRNRPQFYTPQQVPQARGQPVEGSAEDLYSRLLNREY